MKPEFALSLSFDAVTLLFRHESGWRRVGEVRLAAEDMPAELDTLRRKAETLATGAVTTKLIIPNDQIRYISVETGRKLQNARRKAAGKALEGATPYDVADLAFDIRADGRNTHVAAVAIETLQEAEDFALEHGFGPVSFVATPDQDDFTGEAFFGATRTAKGKNIEPDSAAVMDMGPLFSEGALLPEAPEPSSLAPQIPAADHQRTDPKHSDTKRADKTDGGKARRDNKQTDPKHANVQKTTTDHDMQDERPQNYSAAEKTTATRPAPNKTGGTSPAAVPATLEAAKALKIPASPALMLSSVDTSNDTGSATAILAPPATIAPAPKVPSSLPLILVDKEEDTAKPEDTTSDDETLGPVVGFSTRRTIAPEKAKTRPNTPDAARRASRLQLTVPDTDADDQGETTTGGRDLPPAPKIVMPSLSPALSHTTSAPPKPSQSPQANGRATPIAKPNSTAADAALAHVPQANPLRTRPKLLGLLAIAIASGVAIGAWTLAKELPVLWGDLKRADLVETKDPVAPPVILKTPVTATTSLAAAPVAPPKHSTEALPNAPAEDHAPRTPQPSNLTAPQEHSPSDLPSLPQTEDDGGVPPADLAALTTLSAPAEDDLGLLTSQELVIASLPAPMRVPTTSEGANQTNDASLFDANIATSQRTDTPSEEDNASLDAPLGIETPEIPTDLEAVADGILDAPQPAISSEEVDTLEQAARYAATGIWQGTPEVSQPPALIHFDNIYVASIDNTNLSQDAVALPDVASLKTDLSLGPVSNPTAAGRQFELDARGLVTATPEGTMNPEGIMVFSGRPDTRPPATPARPSASDTEAAEKVERDKVLSLVRPRSRPANLIEQAERAQLGGISRAELANLRPKARPDSLKSVAEESQPATERAVATAQSPRSRPANFASIVDRSRTLTAARTDKDADKPSSAATAVATGRSPQIPSSASVARQATVRGALNLRRLNLIGVAGTPSDRRAMVRLPSGRMVELKVGDRIDGGHVVAIGDSQLQYQKGGRNNTLTMPKG